MKRVLAAIGFVCLALPVCAQNLNKNLNQNLTDDNAISASAERPEKAEASAVRSAPPESHNFFNWKNSIVFGVQAAGVVWYARERNGTLSNVTNFDYWQRGQYLKNAYLQASFFALAADGVAYGIHKSGNGWKRHLAEHLLIQGSTVALYVFANRNRHEYNTQECRGGLSGFCQ